MSCARSTRSSPTTRDERPGAMNLQLVSEVLFTLGRRSPRLPFAFLRAMPLGLLHALRSPGLRETIRVAARASYYRDAFAARRVDVARARRPEDLGDFYLTPGILKTRPEALVAEGQRQRSARRGVVRTLVGGYTLLARGECN